MNTDKDKTSSKYKPFLLTSRQPFRLDGLSLQSRHAGKNDLFIEQTDLDSVGELSIGKQPTSKCV